MWKRRRGRSGEMSTENRNSQTQRPSSQANKPKWRALSHYLNLELGSTQIAVIFHRNWAQTFSRMRWAAITALETPGLMLRNWFFYRDLFFRGIWLDGAGDEAVGLTPTALSYSQQCKIFPPWGSRRRSGETDNERRDNLCSLAKTNHFFLCKWTGYRAQCCTPCQHKKRWKMDTSWNLWGFDSYFISCVCCTPVT